MAHNTIFEVPNVFLHSRNQSQSGFWGGSLGGLIIALLVISMKWLGYSDLPMAEYVKLWPKMLFFGTIAGGFGGWLSCRLACIINQGDCTFKGSLHKVMVFASGFIVLSLARQLSVRDSLRLPGSHEIVDRKGNLEIVGGVLGEPNFETIAAGLLGGASFLILVMSLNKKQKANNKTALIVALKATAVGVTFWSLTYLFYCLSTELGVFDNRYRYPQDRQVSTMFIVDFPHPEYVVLFVAGCLIYVYSVMSSIASHQVGVRKIKLCKADQELMARIEASVKENMGNLDFGAVQLAHKVNLSVRSLNRFVKKLTSKSTTLFIRELRLKQAAYLLEENFGSITEICYEVGFRNMSYFERSFKAYFNVTASEYKTRTSTTPE